MLKRTGRKICNGLDLKKLFQIEQTITLPSSDKTKDKFYQKYFSFEKETKQVIVNACPTDPFSIPLNILDSEIRFNRFIATLNWISKKLPVHIVIDYKKKGLIKKIARKKPKDSAATNALNAGSVPLPAPPRSS